MAQAKYIVTLNEDGTLATESVEAGEGILRTATTFDTTKAAKN